MLRSTKNWPCIQDDLSFVDLTRSKLYCTGSRSVEVSLWREHPKNAFSWYGLATLMYMSPLSSPHPRPAASARWCWRRQLCCMDHTCWKPRVFKSLNHVGVSWMYQTWFFLNIVLPSSYYAIWCAGYTEPLPPILREKRYTRGDSGKGIKVI